MNETHTETQAVSCFNLILTQGRPMNQGPGSYSQVGQLGQSLSESQGFTYNPFHNDWNHPSKALSGLGQLSTRLN